MPSFNTDIQWIKCTEQWKVLVPTYLTLQNSIPTTWFNILLNVIFVINNSYILYTVETLLKTNTNKYSSILTDERCPELLLKLYSSCHRFLKENRSPSSIEIWCSKIQANFSYSRPIFTKTKLTFRVRRILNCTVAVASFWKVFELFYCSSVQ